MEVKSINLDKINIKENVRIKENGKELVELMESIKQDGLLQPVGVIIKKGGRYDYVWGFRRIQACKKLGRKQIDAVIMNDSNIISEQDVSFINIIENIHRKDISPFELGRICSGFKNDGMTTPEIAVRLSLPVSKINQAIDIYKINLSKKIRDKVVYCKGRSVPKGKISVDMVVAISGSGLKIKTTEKLLKIVNEKQMSTSNVRHLLALMGRGMEFEKALKEMNVWSARTVTLVINKKVWEKHKGEMTLTEMFKEVMMKRMKCPKGLIYDKD